MQYQKLKGKITEEGLNQAQLAVAIGISVSSLNAKLNGKRQFTLGEAGKLIECLRIDDPNDYFF